MGRGPIASPFHFHFCISKKNQDLLVRFGYNLAQLFRDIPWSYCPAYTQIGQVDLDFLEMQKWKCSRNATVNFWLRCNFNVFPMKAMQCLCFFHISSHPWPIGRIIYAQPSRPIILRWLSQFRDRSLAMICCGKPKNIFLRQNQKSPIKCRPEINIKCPRIN